MPRQLIEPSHHSHKSLDGSALSALCSAEEFEQELTRATTCTKDSNMPNFKSVTAQALIGALLFVTAGFHAGLNT